MYRGSRGLGALPSPLRDGMLVQSETSARVAGIGGFNAYLIRGEKLYMFPDGITANAYGAADPSKVVVISDGLFNSLTRAVNADGSLAYVGSPLAASEAGVPAVFADAPNFTGVSNFLQTPQAIAQAVAAGVPAAVITAPYGTVISTPATAPATPASGTLTAPTGPTPLGASAAAPASSSFSTIALLAAAGVAAFLLFGGK